jgi:hypothetical protein
MQSQPDQWHLVDLFGLWNRAMDAMLSLRQEQRSVIERICEQQQFGAFEVTGRLTVNRVCTLSGFITETPTCCFNQTISGALQHDGQAGSGVMTDRPGAPIDELGSLFSLVRRP